MSSNSTAIPPETARHVLWHFGADGGWQPGSFTQRLMEAFAAADVTHTARLAIAYPDYAAAFTAAQYDPDGIANLQRIAGGLACIRCGDVDGPFVGAPKQPLCEPCYAKGSQQ